jgi:hypothetical protein
MLQTPRPCKMDILANYLIQPNFKMKMFNVGDHDISLILILHDAVEFCSTNKLYCQRPYLDMPVICK